MFQRGHKVEVIESNAIKGMRPRKGDIGYLNNMFLFPREKFILTDIFFFLRGQKTHKVEHKKFIIDLGMSKSDKNLISRTGVNKLFFVSKPNTCLNPTMVSPFMTVCNKNPITGVRKDISSTYLAIPQLVGTYGVWDGCMKLSNKIYQPNKASKSKKYKAVDGKFKIPIGHIKKVFGPCDKLNMDANELRAWINSISAILYTSVYGKQVWFINEKTNNKSSYDHINAHISVLADMIINNFTIIDGNDLIICIHPNKNTKITQKLIGEICFALSTHHSFYNRMLSIIYDLISVLIKANTPSVSATIFKNALSENGCEEINKLLEIPNLFKSYQAIGINKLSTIFILANLFYIGMFSLQDTKTFINNYINLLPRNIDANGLIRSIDEAKTKSNEGSAALSRVFDEITNLNTNKNKGGSVYEGIKLNTGINWGNIVSDEITLSENDTLTF